MNLIPTALGGTHESGLRAGTFEAVKSFIEHHALLPRGIKLQQEDVCGRMSFILSARILDPQFQGQVKEKLNSREAVKLVSTMIRDPLEIWLNNHVDAGKAIAQLAIRQAEARLRTAQKVEKKKSSGVAVLPGKLSDCESETIGENELFLVEGDSAGGSAKMARVAMPPLYRVDVPAQGKKRPAKRLYALDEGELEAIRDRLKKEGMNPDAIEIGRFKGLGEMNPEQLRETTMDPATRRVLPVQLREGCAEETRKMFTLLMAKGEAAGRRGWMEEKGNLVEADV